MAKQTVQLIITVVPDMNAMIRKMGFQVLKQAVITSP